MTQTELLQFALALLERLQIPYAIVGSFATAVWGDPRMTRDIDIVVQLTEEQVEAICAAFPPDDFGTPLRRRSPNEVSSTSFTSAPAIKSIS